MSHRKIIYDIRRLTIVLVLLIVASFEVDMLAVKPTRQASVAKNTRAHQHVVHGWPLLSEGSVLDEVSAVGVDSKDNVFVLQRGGRKMFSPHLTSKRPVRPSNRNTVGTAMGVLSSTSESGLVGPEDGQRTLQLLFALRIVDNRCARSTLTFGDAH